MHLSIAFILSKHERKLPLLRSKSGNKIEIEREKEKKNYWNYGILLGIHPLHSVS